MNAKGKQVLLAQYRIKQAKESLEEAEYLFTGEKSPRSVINRAYYAMYYSTLALIVFENHITSKHTGVIAFFNKNYIKEAIFPNDMGRWINKAFELRQTEDYREYSELTAGEVEPYLDYTRIFIEKVEEYLLEKHFQSGKDTGK